MHEKITINFDGRKHDIADLIVKIQSQSNQINVIRCIHLNIIQKEKLLLALQMVHTLETLAIEQTKININDAVAIANIISINFGLLKLSLENDQIGPVGIKPILQAIEPHPNLEVLNLNGNVICSPKARSFQDLLGHHIHHKHLESLERDNNPHRSKLKHLSNVAVMFWNKITEPDITPIAELLVVNRVLKEVCLRGNNLINTDAEKILAALRINRSITYLDLVTDNFLFLRQYGNVIEANNKPSIQKILDEIGDRLMFNMEYNPDNKAKQTCHFHPRAYEDREDFCSEELSSEFHNAI